MGWRLSPDRSDQEGQRFTVHQLNRISFGEIPGFLGVNTGGHKNAFGCTLCLRYPKKLTHRFYPNFLNAPLFALDEKRLSRTVLQLEVNSTICSTTSGFRNLVSQTAVCLTHEKLEF